MKQQTTIYTLKKKNTNPKRRRKGQGTVWQDSSGKWRGQITIGIKSTGAAERRSFSGSTEEEVQKKMNEFIQLANAPIMTQTDPVWTPEPKKANKKTRVTVEQIIHRWLWDYKRIEICSKTCEWYEHLIHKMIEPHIGGLSLDRINTLTIQTLINRLTMVDNYASRTVRGVRSILVQSFDLACQLGLMQGNPATAVKLPKTRRRGKKDEEKAISAEVCAKLLQAAQSDPMMHTVITTLLFTGLRIGELLALRWCDIDYEQKSLTVDEAVVRRPVYNEQGDKTALKIEVGEPKTAGSYRTVQLSEPVIEALQEWYQYLAHQPYGKWRIRPENFIFASSQTKTAYSYDGFRSMYTRFLKRNGLQQYGINLHRFRHTFATLLMEAGTNPKVVQSQLGHSSITTTLGIYTHVTPALKDAVGDALDSAYHRLNV